MPRGSTDLSKVLNPALGVVLRKVRERQDIDRAVLVARIPDVCSGQAIANYEYGIRSCAVARLVEISMGLRVDPVDLLNRALQVAGIERTWVEFRVLPSLTTEEWARKVALLDDALVEELVAALGIERSTLVGHLLQLAPHEDDD
jgi:hypothetical protein